MYYKNPLYLLLGVLAIYSKVHWTVILNAKISFLTTWWIPVTSSIN